MLSRYAPMMMLRVAAHAILMTRSSFLRYADYLLIFHAYYLCYLFRFISFIDTLSSCRDAIILLFVIDIATLITPLHDMLF